MAGNVFAGELGSDAIGKTIRVKIGAHVTVEDEIEAIGHVGGTDPIRTLIVFKTITPDTMDPTSLIAAFSLLHPKQGFLVAHDDFVTVVSR